MYGALIRTAVFDRQHADIAHVITWGFVVRIVSLVSRCVAIEQLISITETHASTNLFGQVGREADFMGGSVGVCSLHRIRDPLHLVTELPDHFARDTPGAMIQGARRARSDATTQGSLSSDLCRAQWTCNHMPICSVIRSIDVARTAC